MLVHLLAIDAFDEPEIEGPPLPAAIRAAILLMVQDMYEGGEAAPSTVSVENLLGPFRIYA